MHAPQIFMAAGHRDAIAGIVEGVLGSPDSVVLSGPAGAGKTTVLDAAVAELTFASARVVRVVASAAGSVGLRDFMAQVVGLDDAEGLTDEDLERVFEALTVPADDGARIVLVIDGTEALLLEVLRYIQLACTVQPRLQVVFSGRPEFEGHLRDGEFAFLRSRLARTLALPALSDEEATGFIGHRLRMAGLPSGEMIANGTLAALLRHGRGNPGRIAAVLDRALAAQSCVQHDADPFATPRDPARAEASAAQADLAAAAQANIPDERAAAPIRSADRRRLRPPAWVLVWIGLVAEVGLGTAILAGTAPGPDAVPLQHAQLAAAVRSSPVATSAGVGAPGNPFQSDRGAGQADALVAKTFPEAEQRVAVAAPLAPQQVMSDPRGASPTRPDPTAPVLPAPGQAGVAALQAPEAVVPPPEPPTPLRTPGSAEPAPSMAGSDEAHVVASAAPATTASPPEPPPPPPQPATAGQLASAFSMPPASVSSGSHGAQRPFRRGGSTHLATPVEHGGLAWGAQYHASSLPLVVPGPSSLASTTGRPASGYIGVYATGADGVRVFRAGPYSLSAEVPGPDRR